VFKFSSLLLFAFFVWLIFHGAAAFLWRIKRRFAEIPAAPFPGN